MMNIVHTSHKITMDVICLLENQNQMTIYHLITNNDLVFCKNLSCMHTCVCLVMLLKYKIYPILGYLITIIL